MPGQDTQQAGRPRKLTTRLGVALILSQCLAANPALACRENAMIAFDASGSMARQRNGRSKIDIARRAAAEILPNITKNRPTGLVTYGGIDGPACRDVIVRVEPQTGSGRQIVAELQRIPPVGPTPLTESVRVAADVLLQRGGPGIVVLITDGLESCGGKVCELAGQLAKLGGNLRVHVIGFFLDDKPIDTLKCLTAATNGMYVAANSLKSLREALHMLLGCIRVSGLGR